MRDVGRGSGPGFNELMALRRDDERKRQAGLVHRMTQRRKRRPSRRLARVHVRAAHRDNLRSELRPEESLIIEWPESQAQLTKY
jgi:hypothetical protein